ncbi:MAG: hypothetical protein HN846_00230 [Candidatus Pacebacteria bacterium]|nr:hypothetical protein [Candidatus Paceibacterota bacterium]MBT3511635.1 hypothetical protein [Candidatus Paceibacterota bacterium]MBT4004602.1 hypothetical protein [Candidatus Paceibacterota bacterium]MBT4358897.1 hypothetical protein [Candidatus Paceibacterota bacterium]MBT4681241.1 hypothetical protein [Candidatus Paceibacterota bacterium]
MRKLSDIFAHIFHPRRSNNHRPRLLHPESLFFLVLVSSGFVALLHLFSGLSKPNNSILGYASTITPKQVIALTNEKRTSLGLDSLVFNQSLSEAALAKGQDMFADQYWSHVAPDGVNPWYFIKQAGYKYRLAGENLARDFSNTESMMAAWMSSPTHRANIVNSRYEEIGIAVIDGTLDGYETTLVVQMFGAQANVATKPVLADEKEGGEFTVQESVSQELALQESGDAVKRPRANVLASVLVSGGGIESPPLFTPLQLTKAFFLAVIMLIVGTLSYDTLVIGHRGATRLVGKNLAHIFILMTVMYLVIFFKGGVVG